MERKGDKAEDCFNWRHKMSQRQRTFQRRVIPPTMAWYMRCTGFNRRKERAAASLQQEEGQAGEHN